MALIDFLFIIPLDDEWEVIRPILASEAKEHTDGPVTYYYWKHNFIKDKGLNPYINVAVSMGKMGLAATGISVTRALNIWQPANAVLLGIAGSFLPKEHQLGDVVFSEEIYGYEIGSVSGRFISNFVFRKTGYQPDTLLWDRLRAFKSDEQSYNDWRDHCFQSDEAKQVKEINSKIKPPMIHRGISASGNFVVKTKKFITQLKNQIDSRICAVEMEAKGHFEAVHSSGVKADTIMVRGISDYADAKKSKLEKKSKDAWRRYAASNTARLFKALLNRKTIEIKSFANYSIKIENRNDRLDSEQISLKTANTQQFDFSLNFMSRPIPKVEIEIYGITNINNHIKPSRALCVYYQNNLSIRFNATFKNQSVKFEIPRINEVGEFAILLAFETSINRIDFDIIDEFDRNYKLVWEYNS